MSSVVRDLAPETASLVATPASRRHLRDVLPAVLVVGAAVVFTARIGTPSLWLDEAYSHRFAQLSLADLWEQIRLDGGSQGLYYLLLSGWQELGESETWLRLPSVAFAVAGLVAFHRLAVLLVDRTVAAVALGLLAVNPFLFRYAQEARSYTLSLLLATLSTLLFVRAVEQRRARTWAIYAALSVLSVWTHLFGFFYIAAHMLSLLVFGPRKLPWRTMALTGAGALVAVVPLLVLARRAGTDGVAYLGPTQFSDVRGVAMSLAGDRGSLAGGAILLFCGVGFVSAVATVRRAAPSLIAWRAALVASWAVAAPALALAVSLVDTPVFRDKYLIGALPGACLLAAVGITRLRSRALVAGLLAVVVVVSGVRLADRMGELHQEEDWRAIAAHTLGEGAPDARFVFYNPWMTSAFRYSLERTGPEHLARRTLIPGRGWTSFEELPIRVGHYAAADLDALCEAAAAPLWLVLHDYRGDEAVSLADVTAALSSTHELRDSRSFSIIGLQRYEPRRDGPTVCARERSVTGGSSNRARAGSP